MAIFSTEDSIEEILKKINASQGVTETVHTGLAFLNYRFQREMTENQNIYNSKQLFWSRIVAVATAVSAIAVSVSLLISTFCEL